MSFKALIHDVDNAGCAAAHLDRLMVGQSIASTRGITCGECLAPHLAALAGAVISLSAVRPPPPPTEEAQRIMAMGERILAKHKGERRTITIGRGQE